MEEALAILTDSTLKALSFGVVGLYVVSLTAITLYCLMQFQLLFFYKKNKKQYQKFLNSIDTDDRFLPHVTVQLPIYNELHVVQRLIQSIINLDYPKSLLEIQVLDDSTDETVDIIAAEIEKYRHQGYDIKHIRRIVREGYKAGALKHGTSIAKGEFIAIFDADFLPKPEFLKASLPYFQNSKIAVVQTRWDHLNQNYSLLTKVQAFQLNVHFTIEQLGRKLGNLFLQFNGTAGIWRKSAIHDAGGWEADTLTEDLDLSYRAQLKGWEIIYLEDLVSPAELPAEINGLKSQQYRWMKGGAETAKKVLPTIWTSNLSWLQKIHASMHLLGSTVFLAVFTVGFFSVPMAMILQPLGIDTNYFSIFLMGLTSIVIIYYVANVQVVWNNDHWTKTILKFLFLFPVFLALSMGLSFHNSIAVLQGYLGRKSAFIRTPKYDIKSITDKIVGKEYFQSGVSRVTIWEGILFLYFIAGTAWSIINQESAFLLMHVMLAVGYGLIFYFSIRNAISR